jgi:hypothetical protein
MARMIPPRVHEDTPASERRIFDLLRLDPATTDWTVLHSLGLSHRGRKPFGEIDFVVLVPGAGVACLEVKGGRIRCEDGIWYTRNRHNRETALPRSPITQAREGVFGLRDAVQRDFGAGSEVGRLIFAALAVFPDVPRPPQSPEYERWEVIDVDDLRAPISGAITRSLVEMEGRLGRSGAARLATASNLKSLRNFLRPDFDVGMARSTSIQRSEDRIVRLTEEQYDVLDLFELNPRCLVQGAAGTGKTMLALEFARRVAPEASKVLLFSYNRLLGDWIAGRSADLLPGGVVVSGSYHSCLRQLILSSAVAEEFLSAERSARGDDEDLFGLVYPLFGQLAVAECSPRADLLILDEAQDLITEPVLDVLNEWLIGGLAGGRWVMLGDFTRQAIYTENDHAWREILSRYVDRFTHSVLRRNCRNTRSIGEETALLSGFESLPYRLDDDDCLPVDYRYWRDLGHQRRRLEEVLQTLNDDGVASDDIILLSPRRFENSVAAELQPGAVAPLDKYRDGEQAVRFSTIHAFKGLESPIVVLCDVEDVAQPRARSLVYTGMSRARSHLIVLLQDRLQGVVSDAVGRRLSEGWKT